MHRPATNCWPVRVLLDENLPRALGAELTEHSVSTVRGLGWEGLDNGDLLRAANKRFDAFVTMDRGIRYQQNLKDLDLGILVLRAPSNKIEDLKPLVPRVLTALETLPRDAVREVRTTTPTHAKEWEEPSR